MANPIHGDGATVERGAIPTQVVRHWLPLVVALAILLGLIYAASVLQDMDGRGTPHVFSLLIGAALGVVFQRGRFCFFCIQRDFVENRDSRALYAVLAALAVGGVGYTILFGLFLPKPDLGRLPPDAHIGPVSWVLVAAGVAFGLGMALSGACLSGHLYRLGEGYSRAPIALFGCLIGFGLGFYTWREVYLAAISQAEEIWLPHILGYGGALAVHLAILALLGLALLRWLPERPAQPAQQPDLKSIWQQVIVQRWNPVVTGATVGIISMMAYLRIEPLGVTSQIGSATRTWMSDQNLLADRLNGLDTFTGCATVVAHTVTENGLFIGGMVLGSFAVALLGGHFRLSRLTPRNSLTALLGGILMGWGAMLALGCTVGTLLSGISALALSGWVFGAATFGGVWLGIRLGLHRS